MNNAQDELLSLIGQTDSLMRGIDTLAKEAPDDAKKILAKVRKSVFDAAMPLRMLENKLVTTAWGGKLAEAADAGNNETQQ